MTHFGSINLGNVNGCPFSIGEWLVVMENINLDRPGQATFEVMPECFVTRSSGPNNLKQGQRAKIANVLVTNNKCIYLVSIIMGEGKTAREIKVVGSKECIEWLFTKEADADAEIKKRKTVKHTTPKTQTTAPTPKIIPVSQPKQAQFPALKLEPPKEASAIWVPTTRVISPPKKPRKPVGPFTKKKGFEKKYEEEEGYED